MLCYYVLNPLPNCSVGAETAKSLSPMAVLVLIRASSFMVSADRRCRPAAADAKTQSSVGRQTAAEADI